VIYKEEGRDWLYELLATYHQTEKVLNPDSQIAENINDYYDENTN